MIAGIGTDIIEVERVARKIEKQMGFKEMIFSLDEISYCESKRNKAQHYAGRFAAKEAFLKASGLGLSVTYDLREIEIAHDETGKPLVKLNGHFERIAIDKQWKAIHVSISHIKEIASAIVMIEK